MNHSPAKILLEYLVSLTPTIVTRHGNNGDWPISAGSMDTKPDDTITVYDTAGVQDGRDHRSLKTKEHFGVQIRVRSKDRPNGWAKTKELADKLDQIQNAVVTIDGTSYTIHAATRTSSILPLGETPEGRRFLHTVNHILTITET